MSGIDKLAATLGMDNDLDAVEKDNLLYAAAAEIQRLSNSVRIRDEEIERLRFYVSEWENDAKDRRKAKA